jgi:hypothetical protein
MRDRLKTAPLKKAIWQMKLKYCLGATCFSKKQCDTLQARPIPSVISVQNGYQPHNSQQPQQFGTMGQEQLHSAV